MKVEMIESPTEQDWAQVYRRALITMGKDVVKVPSDEWKARILRAKHSPIRRLHFAFYIECPYWVSVHLCRHIHAQPYVGTQRNDRQDKYDRRKAPQDAEVVLIWDVNGEELITVFNKRLCNKASEETREVIQKIRDLVVAKYPEYKDVAVPMCEREHVCNEMFPCGKK